MAKIYPDTNYFIDFYRVAKESFDILDELQQYKTSLVLTEQTVTEFRRNRVSTLNWFEHSVQRVDQSQRAICKLR